MNYQDLHLVVWNHLGAHSPLMVLHIPLTEELYCTESKCE